MKKLTNRELRYKVREIRDSLNPKNTDCHGFMDKEVFMLENLISYFNKLVSEEEEKRLLEAEKERDNGR